MKRILMIATLLPAAAWAQETPGISELVLDSIGYVNVRPGVVLIEGEGHGAHFCRIDVSDEDFRAYASGNADTLDSTDIICIPASEFEE